MHHSLYAFNKKQRTHKFWCMTNLLLGEPQVAYQFAEVLWWKASHRQMVN